MSDLIPAEEADNRIVDLIERLDEWDIAFDFDEAKEFARLLTQINRERRNLRAGIEEHLKDGYDLHYVLGLARSREFGRH